MKPSTTLRSLLSTFVIALSLSVQAQNSGTSEYGPFFQHTVNAGNVTDNWTDMTHPALDGINNAVALYTHNWNPNNAGSGVYCDFPTGLWYSGSPAWAIYAQNWLTDTMPYNSVWNVLVTNAPATSAYLWSDSASTTLNWMYIDDPDINGNQDAIFFVSQNYAPNSVYNLSPIGIWYDVYNGMWGVYNQDQASMDPGAGFNVFIPTTGSNVYTHVADVSNSFFNYTVLDHPSLNGDSSKTIIVTQNWNPDDTIGVYNDNEIGVWYTGTNWAIYNEDGTTPIPDGAAFNVLVLSTVTGTDDLGISNDISLFPNPANDEVTLRYTSHAGGDAVLNVTSMMGSLVLQKNLNSRPAGTHSVTLDVSQLAAGIYCCSIEAEGRTSTALLTVE